MHPFCPICRALLPAASVDPYADCPNCIGGAWADDNARALQCARHSIPEIGVAESFVFETLQLSRARYAGPSASAGN